MSDGESDSKKMEPEEQKESQSDKGEKKEEKFVKGRAYWDKELDLPVVEIKLHRTARKLLSEFCVRTGDGSYYDGKENKSRWLVKRVVTGKYDLNSQYGVFFDKKLIEAEDRERKVYFATYQQALSFSQNVRRFFEDLIEGSLELKKEYNFTISLREEQETDKKE